jgi:predicted kinase
MEMVYQAAAFLLDKGRTVILDGRPYSQAYQVERLQAFASAAQAPLKLIECVAPDEVIRQRLEVDVAEGRHPAQNRTFAMYCQVKAAADPITIPHLVVDTSRPLEECVEDCLTYITPPHPPAPLINGGKSPGIPPLARGVRGDSIREKEK